MHFTDHNIQFLQVGVTIIGSFSIVSVESGSIIVTLAVGSPVTQQAVTTYVSQGNLKLSVAICGWRRGWGPIIYEHVPLNM